MKCKNACGRCLWDSLYSINSSHWWKIFIISRILMTRLAENTKALLTSNEVLRWSTTWKHHLETRRKAPLVCFMIQDGWRTLKSTSVVGCEWKDYLLWRNETVPMNELTKKRDGLQKESYPRWFVIWRQVSTTTFIKFWYMLWLWSNLKFSSWK